MKIGTLREIWRYPVKSMMGERLSSAEAGATGIPGDRAWAVRDEVKGGIRGAKKIAGLMRLAARYPEPPTAARAGRAEIRLCDGSTLMTDAADASERLSAELGQPVTLWPLQPTDKLDHYRRGAPDHEDLEQELREIFALEDGESLPDLSGMPAEIFEYESPPGTYFDAFPLLVMTEASLAALARHAPDSVIDVRRFRPNLLVATDGTGADGFVEATWIGKRLRVGSLTITIETACPRCVMTTRPFADLPYDPDIMRTLVREANHELGVYASISAPGTFAVGDDVELVD